MNKTGMIQANFVGALIRLSAMCYSELPSGDIAAKFSALCKNQVGHHSLLYPLLHPLPHTFPHPLLHSLLYPLTTTITTPLSTPLRSRTTCCAGCACSTTISPR